jgi:ParB-like chromosome segregation protein Spo0J
MTHETEASFEEATFQFVPGAVKQAMAGCKSADLWKVPVNRLRVIDGFNPRIMSESYKTRIRWICDSIKANGFYPDQPLAGYVARDGSENVIYITNGHTRYAALMLAIEEGAEITEVPVVTKPNGTSMEDLTVALVTSNSGAPLTPFEVALVCKRLVKYGVPENEIATRLGISETHVKNYLFLMAAPREVHQLVIEEKVSATLAIETLRKHGSDAVKLLTEGVIAAQESGKDRATKKDLAKKSPAAVPRFSKTQMKLGISYVVENKLDQDERILNLLAFLSGTGIEDVRKLLAQPAAEEQASKNGKKSTGAQAPDAAHV